MRAEIIRKKMQKTVLKQGVQINILKELLNISMAVWLVTIFIILAYNYTIFQLLLS